MFFGGVKIFQVIGLIIDAFILASLSTYTIEQHPKLRHLALISIGEVSLITLLNNFFFLQHFNAIIQVVILTVLIWIITSSNIRAAVLSSILGLCIYICIEDVSTHFTVYISDLTKDVLLYNEYIKYIFLLCVKSSIFIVILLSITKLGIQFKNYFPSLNSSSKIALNRRLNKDFGLIVVSLSLMYFIVFYCSSSCKRISYCLVLETIRYTPLPTTLIMIFFPILAIIIIKQTITIIDDREQSILQVDTLKYVENLININKAQRHDFNHNLQVLYGLIEVDAFKEAKEYIKKNISDISEVTELFKTDNNVLTALLHVKTRIAITKGVILNVEVKCTFIDISLSERDLIIVLGNLIDNAVDAVINNNITNKAVWVLLDADSNNYIFEVKNQNIPGNTLDNKIFLPGVSTKHKGSGMGLFSVKRIVEENNGRVYYGEEDVYTFFRVVIPKKRGAI